MNKWESVMNDGQRCRWWCDSKRVLLWDRIWGYVTLFRFILSKPFRSLQNMWAWFYWTYGFGIAGPLRNNVCAYDFQVDQWAGKYLEIFRHCVASTVCKYFCDGCWKACELRQESLNTWWRTWGNLRFTFSVTSKEVRSTISETFWREYKWMKWDGVIIAFLITIRFRRGD